MDTVSDIFDALNGPAAIARALDVKPSTASEMKRRGAIPGEYWAQLVEHARSVGCEEISYELIARIHAKAKGRLPPSMMAEEMSA
ncbi:carph-isopro domain-containing protein [Bosea sp. ASV33]|uniref:carph-isopro domain-containing protein n=1 Tax=Bosea sp. ASV33 TaxID=2795106 RepID=UPI0018EBDFD7|nr:hypothetical protein [Bosea sp. ASV33]